MPIVARAAREDRVLVSASKKWLASKRDSMLENVGDDGVRCRVRLSVEMIVMLAATMSGGHLEQNCLPELTKVGCAC